MSAFAVSYFCWFDCHISLLKILSNSLSCIMSQCFPSRFPLFSLCVLSPSRLLCVPPSPLPFMIIDHIFLPLFSVQLPYKYTVADVAMRENGFSVHPQASQIPAALVLSDFTGRRVAGNTMIPLFYSVGLLLPVIIFLTLHSVFFLNITNFPSESHYYFILPFVLSLCPFSG